MTPLDRTKWPLWQQYLVALSAAAAVAVVTGVFLMFRSTEELDNEPLAHAQPRVEQDIPSAADDASDTANAPSRSAPPEPRTQPPPEVVASHELGDEPKPFAATTDAVKPATKTAPPTAVQTAQDDASSSKDYHSSKGIAAPAGSDTGSRTAALTPATSTEEQSAVSDRASPNAAAAEQNNWLKMDGNGEPCEVTLADGTTLKLDTYGDSFQGYRAQNPVDGVKEADVIVDYQRDQLGGAGAYFLQLDVAAGKMYWIEVAGGGTCHIRRADLNGGNPQIVLDLRYQNAQALAIDPKRRKLYWANHAPGDHPAFGAPPDAAQAVWQANLDGSDPHPLFTALTNLGAVAVEPQSGIVFYFDGPRVVRGESDGSHEDVVVESLDKPNPFGNVGLIRYKGFNAAIDPKGGKIYWCATQDYIARANLDGSAFEVLSNGVGHIEGVGIDIPNSKLYWAAGPRMGVWRANTDGSQPQMVAHGMEQSSSIGIDSDHGHVYWTDQKFVGGDSYALIRRLPLPPPPRAETTAPPPWVGSIQPSRQSAGGKVTIHGAQFTGVSHVRVIGDDGQQSDAKFNVVDERELALVLPKRQQGVRRAAIVVEGPGGVTVTLPRDVYVIKPNGRRFTVFDRFHASDFCFVISPEQGFHRVEHSLVFVPEGTNASAGGRGNTVLFVKDGGTGSATDAMGVVIYHEPFAKITRRAWGAGERQYIPVPAIRPSFVDALLEFADDE